MRLIVLGYRKTIMSPCRPFAPVHMTHHFDVVPPPFRNSGAMALHPPPPTNPCYIVYIFLHDEKCICTPRPRFFFGGKVWRIWGSYAVALIERDTLYQKDILYIKIRLCAQDEDNICNTIIMWPLKEKSNIYSCSLQIFHINSLFNSMYKIWPFNWIKH